MLSTCLLPITVAIDMPEVLSLVVEGRLDPKKLVEREVTLNEGAAALEDMDKGSPIGITMITKFGRHITPLKSEDALKSEPS